MKKTVTTKVFQDGKMIVLYIVTMITFCALNSMVLQASDYDSGHSYAENDIFKLINEEQDESVLQILNEQERAGQPTASAGEYSLEPELKVKEWMLNIDSWCQDTLLAEH